ncbi:MAG: hypothetical protein ACXVHC_08360 [Frankiaceae bacterium]
MAVVVVIETRWAAKDIVIHARAEDGLAAESYLHDALDRAAARRTTCGAGACM